MTDVLFDPENPMSEDQLEKHLTELGPALAELLVQDPDIAADYGFRPSGGTMELLSGADPDPTPDSSREVIGFWKWLMGAYQKSGAAEEVVVGLPLFHIDVEKSIDGGLKTEVTFTGGVSHEGEITIESTGFSGGGSFKQTLNAKIESDAMKGSFQVLLPATVAYQKWRNTLNNRYVYTARITGLDTPPFFRLPGEEHHVPMDGDWKEIPFGNPSAPFKYTVSKEENFSISAKVPVLEKFSLSYKASVSNELDVTIDCFRAEARRLQKLDGRELLLKVLEG